MRRIPLKRVFNKPLSVINFRLKQDITLRYKRVTGFWRRFSDKTEKRYRKHRILSSSTVLITPSSVFLSGLQREIIHNMASSIISSKFEVFGYKVPELDKYDFTTDWRFNKKWENQYYKSYNFYEERNEQYDAKFPWELSRFHYLIPVLAYLWVEETDVDYLDKIRSILRAWREKNPLAYSVNWYPMEASMRVINLVMMVDFVRLLKKRENKRYSELDELGDQLVIMLVEHGVFIWNNIEFTDVRGNHFTANLVALLLVSYSLGTGVRECRKWREYALKWLDKEISSQFYPDGVNFEKSCAYHKLVFELFMLAAIARDRIGNPFSSSKIAFLHKAAVFSDAVMRPDKKAANFGDIDDATALPFTFTKPRSHAAVIELARSFFNKDLGTQEYDEIDRVSSLFLLGKAYKQRSTNKPFEVRHFSKGGYVVVRSQERGFYFIADIGEVGMLGRGGHGHNDLLSFELCIDGQPIVVDPGCSCYTADLAKKDLYRSTSSHATIELFGEEIARFTSCWGISDEAHPLDVAVSEKDDVATIRAGHDGYDRIASGTRVWRTFEVKPLKQELVIKDEIHVTSPVVDACWNFPLGECLASATDSKNVNLVQDENDCVRFGAECPVNIHSYLYSEGYGQETKNPKIAARLRVNKGIQVYRFCFYKKSRVKN